MFVATVGFTDSTAEKVSSAKGTAEHQAPPQWPRLDLRQVDVPHGKHRQSPVQATRPAGHGISVISISVSCLPRRSHSTGKRSCQIANLRQMLTEQG